MKKLVFVLFLMSVVSGYAQEALTPMGSILESKKGSNRQLAAICLHDREAGEECHEYQIVERSKNWKKGCRLVAESSEDIDLKFIMKKASTRRVLVTPVNIGEYYLVGTFTGFQYCMISLGTFCPISIPVGIAVDIVKSPLLLAGQVLSTTVGLRHKIALRKKVKAMFKDSKIGKTKKIDLKSFSAIKDTFDYWPNKDRWEDGTIYSDNIIVDCKL